MVGGRRFGTEQCHVTIDKCRMSKGRAEEARARMEVIW